MPQNPITPDELNPAENNSSEENSSEERFESDTQRIIHRHLQNKNDVITEEDIASIRVGMTPDMDEATASRFEDDDATEDVEEELLGEDTEDADANKDDKITPWDTLESDR